MKRYVYFFVMLGGCFAFNFCKHKPNEIIPKFEDTTKVNITPPPTNNNTPNNIADSVCFSEQLGPLINSSCAKSGCHDETTKQSGLVLNNYANIKRSISGTLLLQVIQDNGTLGMPPAPNAKFTASQIQLVKKWVDEGMKDGIDCLGACDTADIKYSTTIKGILDNGCIGCHDSNSGGTLLNDYNSVKTQVTNDKLYCVVIHGNGCQPMPKNGQKLSACKIKQIKKWIDAGAPNN